MNRVEADIAYVVDLAVRLMKIYPTRYSDIGSGIEFDQAVSDALDLIDTAEAKVRPTRELDTTRKTPHE